MNVIAKISCYFERDMHFQIALTCDHLTGYD